MWRNDEVRSINRFWQLDDGRVQGRREIVKQVENGSKVYNSVACTNGT